MTDKRDTPPAETGPPGLECQHCSFRYPGFSPPCPRCGKTSAQKTITMRVPAEPAAPVSPPTPKFSFLDSGEIDDMPSEVAPVSPEPPQDVVNYEQRIHPRTGEMTLRSAAGTVGATPDWERMYRDLSASYAKICAAVGPMDEFDEVDTVVELIHELRASLPSPAPQDAAIRADEREKVCREIEQYAAHRTITRGSIAAAVAKVRAASPAQPVGTDQVTYEQRIHPRTGEMTLHGGPAQPVGSADRPKIICLCGSTKFIEQFAIKTWELELEGHIVLGCTLLPSWYCPVRDHFAETMGVKPQRDEHHLRKIDLADEVLVLNVGGYIGESTRNEIAYAAKTGKPVRYLEPVGSADKEQK